MDTEKELTRTPPYGIHPVTGAVVDANQKSVLIPLRSAYGAEDAKALAELVVDILNQRELN